tara:strand:+ start:987 stop:1280 length:294 start_codon:yes stop_codon:yes gene_type:complete
MNPREEIAKRVEDLVLDISYFYKKTNKKAFLPKVTFSHEYWKACRASIVFRMSNGTVEKLTKVEGNKMKLPNGLVIYYDDSLRGEQFTVENLKHDRL